MHLRRQCQVAVIACLLVVSCGSKPKTFDAVSVRSERSVGSTMQTSVNVSAAGDGAILLRQRQTFIWASAYRAPEPEKEQPVPVTSEPALLRSQGVTDAPAYNWDALAVCETGDDWTAHGSRYSSALGILNQAVYENATEEVAARILNGTASREEQIAVAESIAAKHGIRSWSCWEAAMS